MSKQRCETIVAALNAGGWVPDTATGRNFIFEVPRDPTPVRSLIDELYWLLPLTELLTHGPVRLDLQAKRIRTHGRFPWHQDHRAGQQLGLSLVLQAPAQGGAFEQRLKMRPEAVQQVPAKAGDLHLFDVTDPKLVHRVTALQGERIALAGWIRPQASPSTAGTPTRQ